MDEIRFLLENRMEIEEIVLTSVQEDFSLNRVFIPQQHSKEIVRDDAKRKNQLLFIKINWNGKQVEMRVLKINKNPIFLLCSKIVFL